MTAVQPEYLHNYNYEFDIEISLLLAQLGRRKIFDDQFYYIVKRIIAVDSVDSLCDTPWTMIAFDSFGICARQRNSC
jgi:hypothetical protein